MASKSGDMTIDDAWDFTKATAMAGWSRTTRRMRASATLLLFVYDTSLQTLQCHHTRKLTPFQLSELSSSSTFNTCITGAASITFSTFRIWEQWTGFSVQRLESGSLDRKPGESCSGAAHTTLHGRCATGLALPIHGFTREHPIRESKPVHSRSCEDGQAGSDIYTLEHEHGVTRGNQPIFDELVAIRDGAATRGVAARIPDR